MKLHVRELEFYLDSHIINNLKYNNVKPIADMHNQRNVRLGLREDYQWFHYKLWPVSMENLHDSFVALLPFRPGVLLLFPIKNTFIWLVNLNFSHLSYLITELARIWDNIQYRANVLTGNSNRDS